MGERMLCKLHDHVMHGVGEYVRHCSEEHGGAAIAVTYLDGLPHADQGDARG